MGKELELNEKSSEGLSPNTVLPPQQYCVNAKRRSKKGKSSGKDEVFTMKEDFAEIKFARFRSSSCKSRLSRSHGLEGNNDIETRRVSMYQSSEEVKNVKKMGGRKKIEFSRRSDISLSSSIVDSLCGSDDEDSNHRPSDISQYSNFSSRSSACHEPDNSIGFFEICMHSDAKSKKSTAVEGRGSVKLKSKSDKVADPIMNGNFLLEKEKIHSLQKSLSAKVEASYLISPSLESDCSAKVRFTPVRKKTNNFIKSKSLRSPLSHIAETNEEVKSNETANVMINRTYQKYLLKDLSNTGKHSDIISEFINREIKYSGIASSPVHLHGNLKLENKQGMPFFEFKVKSPEDVFVAKTWRVGNGFNFVYTFHSIDNRKKSNATGTESHDFDKDSSIVAKMLVSSNLCSEIKDKSDNSMVTEFVLYDLSHSRHSVSSEKKSSCEQNVFKTRKASRVGPKEETFEMVEENLAVKNKLQGESNSFSLLPTESYSNLEIAAIVLEIPFSKRESLKYKRGDRLSAKEHSNLSNLCAVVDQNRKSLHDRKFQEQLKVVIPTGYHGLPNAECRGPSPLLDRLRHGGGCDCGGWDMACPLVLLGNPGIQFAEDHSLMEEYQPLELFVQGAKESNPTFSMKMVEEGNYAVDFHAQLSTLQAFSICVAILHGTSASGGPGNEKNQQQLSKCSSMKMLLEDDVECLFKSITTEKNTACKSTKGIPRSYVPNPPFSPIARV
ncbi:hypothetical protein P8452_39887 [Trifolium repens]|nr:hypothetical protein P8452_39887 [Trifolium repens]